VSLERGPLRLVSTTEELLGRTSSGSGLENRDYCRRGLAALTMRHSSSSEKLALAAVSRSVYFNRGLRLRSFYILDVYF
jgi:hypothetical protein